MPACGGDFSLRVLDRAGSSTERDLQPQEARFKLEPGDMEELGGLSEIDPLVEVIAEDSGLEQIAVDASACGAKGKGSKEAVVESIQQDDALLSSTRNHGELSFLHSIQDLSGPLRKVGGGNDGPRHRSASWLEYLKPGELPKPEKGSTLPGSSADLGLHTPRLDLPQPHQQRAPRPAQLVHHKSPPPDTNHPVSDPDRSAILTPMIKVSLQEAEGHLSQLIEEAAAGQDVVITSAGGPAVRLTLVPQEEAQGVEASKVIGHALDRFIGTWSAEQEAEVLQGCRDL